MILSIKLLTNDCCSECIFAVSDFLKSLSTGVIHMECAVIYGCGTLVHEIRNAFTDHCVANPLRIPPSDAGLTKKWRVYDMSFSKDLSC